jgi:two-component system, chemotaxis family, chemotaxis protein CheY
MAIDLASPILVIDDSSVVLHQVCRLLAEIGFSNIQEASDGLDGLMALRSKPFSLVLSDWKMSPMSGLELLRRLRQDAALKAMPFILMSADASPQLANTARKLGADGFLAKPFTAQTLKAAIDQAVEARP